MFYWTDTTCQPRASQKAPSAKRCIKTGCHVAGLSASGVVRKHRAPKGALRPPAEDVQATAAALVRKHRAPKGAVRHLWFDAVAQGGQRQIAPSPQKLACNSLSTHFNNHRKPLSINVLISNMKNSQPNCMRHFPTTLRDGQPPSAKRCIKTRMFVLWSLLT